MSSKVKDFIIGVIAFVILTIVMGGCIWYGTSPEVWYAGMHDAECEDTLHGEKCHCYERFLEREKDK